MGAWVGRWVGAYGACGECEYAMRVRSWLGIGMRLEVGACVIWGTIAIGRNGKMSRARFEWTKI